jgi:cysteine-rich repeat protein
MQTRPVLPVLVFALAGCSIGDNDVVLHGGGDGGGSTGDEPMDGETSDDGGDDEPDTQGGDGEGGDVPDDDDDGGESGESGEDYDDACGDAMLATFEQCDDGNQIDGDGCESNCRVTIGVSTFALGNAHTCAVDYFGDVRCWGSNRHGQLGYASDGIDGVGANMTPAAFGRTVSIGAPVARVALGTDHTCALAVDGAVYCWGRNDDGQLGYGHTDAIADEPGETPESVGPVALGAPAVGIAAGLSHTCALLGNGELRCWGEGSRGQLGIGDGFDGRVGAGQHPYPEVADAPSIDMLDVTTRGIHIGVGEFGCVANDMRRLYCWGANEDGQLGIARDTDVGVDDPAMKQDALLQDRTLRIAVGEAHVCVVTDAFAVQCFGRNTSGQLGYARVDDIGDDEAPLDGVVHLDGHHAVEVAAGADFSCALLDDASVRCWGAGEYGQLGSGFTATMGDNENPADSPAFMAVPVMGFATDIDAGAHHICARTADAKLHCWGRGADGRLGYGDENNVGDSPAALPVKAVPLF